MTIFNRNLLVGALWFSLFFTFSCKEDPLLQPEILDQQFSIPENSVNATIIGIVEATSLNPDEKLLYKIASGNSTNMFSLGVESGELLLADASQLDPASKASYTLSVEVTSSLNTSLKSTAEVIIGIWGIPIALEQEYNVVEQSSIGTNIGRFIVESSNSEESIDFAIVYGNDDNLFEIDNTGNILVLNSEDLTSDDSKVIILGISVTSSLDPLLTTMAEAKITLLLNPRISNQVFDIQENTRNGVELGKLSPESKNEGEILSFEIIAGNENDIFTLDQSNGVITVNKEELLDFEAREDVPITVGVSSDADPEIFTEVSILARITNVISPPLENLQAYYPFYENTLDSSVEGRNGVAAGNPVYVNDRNELPLSALYFDGVNDFVNLGTDVAFNIAEHDDFSFSFWILPEETEYTGERVVLGMYASASNQRIYKISSRPVPDQDIILKMYDNGTSTSQFVNYEYSTQWTHVTVVKQNNNFKLYINGQLKDSTDLTLTLKQGLTNIPLYVGGVYLSNVSPDLLFKGAIDDLAFYHRALTVDDIFTLYNE